MELRHLRYFCAVAETLSFSRAAERLHVAQSALSRQIRDLESEMEVQLLERSTTQVRLTDAGRSFRDSSEKMLTQVAIAVTTAQEIAKGKSGVLRIASDWRLQLNTVAETIAIFRRKYPNITVEFTDCTLNDQLRALRKGEIHIGFLPELTIGARDDLNLFTIFTNSMVAILPVTHPLAQRERIQLKELANERWLVLEDKPGSDVRSFMMQVCRTAGFTPKFGRTSRSITGIMSLVAACEGITLLASSTIPSDNVGLTIMPTDCAPIVGCAVWSKISPSPIVALYIEVLRDYIDRHPRGMN